MSGSNAIAETMSAVKVYFPNLNGLRSIAALMVIVHHIEQLKSVLGMESYWGSVPFISIMGKLGVVLFFVLSGFLITYLLLEEERTYGSMDIVSFYMRRVLRIWPLYFVIVVLALFVLPYIGIFEFPEIGRDAVHTHLLPKVVLFVLFLPNLLLSAFGVVPYASHTWSIGTEEQFYLIWPVLLLIFRKQKLVMLVFVVLAYLAILKLLFTPWTDWVPFRPVVQGYWKLFNIDCMAIGGVYAFLLFHRSRILKVLMDRYVFYAVLILALVLVFTGVNFKHLHYEIYALLFGLLILNFAANDRIGISLENKSLKVLGDISYGLYMYHPITAVLSIQFAIMLGIGTNWFIYPITVGLTIAVAWTSYTYFERWFLRHKTKFTRIKSG